VAFLYFCSTKITDLNKKWRNTSQHPLPAVKPAINKGVYDIYPSFKMDENQVNSGFASLAEVLLKHKTIIIDGYIGVYYDQFRESLNSCLNSKGAKTSWHNTSEFLKDPDNISGIVSPFTGDDDPVFGYRTTLKLADFFDLIRLQGISSDPSSDLNIVIGPGATLTGWKGFLVFLDLPKNEIQFRARAGSISNLGASSPATPGEMYKRFYFVDWIVLNSHKRTIISDVDLFVDTQIPECPNYITGDLLRRSLSVMSHNVFRVRPWFEPGVWGGTWIMNKIGGLNTNVPNYAWSFELITPENGLLLESSGRLLEVSFDFIMYQEAESVLGDCYSRFGTEFPIRFDFLDTFDGGNLSIQCHPRPEYIKRHFGENFTQEETYYILDTKDNAFVYLGFQDNIKPSEFRHDLEESLLKSRPVEIERYVIKHPAKKHDLFLIPYGTIHGSGKNNLVLEISSTPYIFTFKMYDWVRPDLEGKPRPLNINRGMENLFFERRGKYVNENLISKPILTDSGKDWRIYHLPTHETHLYDVHRIHFKSTIEVSTENKCHVLSLVEGSSIIVETASGFSQRFNYAETFVIPAAAGGYRLINESNEEAIVVKAFVK
jgi:mannose-6-phosphate isomerase class I